jgi:hypothetical protein
LVDFFHCWSERPCRRFDDDEETPCGHEAELRDATCGIASCEPSEPCPDGFTCVYEAGTECSDIGVGWCQPAPPET